MAAKKKTASRHVTQETRRANVEKRQARVMLLAQQWARHAETLSVLSSPSHHLLRAIQLWEAEQSA